MARKTALFQNKINGMGIVQSELSKARSSPNLACHHSPPMDCERCGKPWTAELLDDIQYASLVSRLPDNSTKV